VGPVPPALLVSNLQIRFLGAALLVLLATLCHAAPPPYVDIAAAYGVPLKKGIPAVAVLSARGEVIYATRAGELADARSMGDRGIHDVFVKVSAPQK
jgi:hypothetical protein